MPVIRIVLLVSVVGGLTLFALSNLSPVLPLVFLGMQTPALPLAIWVGGAIAAGAITSFFLRLLNALPSSYSTQERVTPRDIPPRSRSFERESPEPQRFYTPPPPEAPTNRYASDWEEQNDENWDFEEEPATSTSNQREFERDRTTAPPPSDRTSYEVKQEPKTASQSGSVYSYSYREPTESGVGKTEAVYDANYRVITPPYQPPTQPEVNEEDDDDWGFEDDEEFSDEYERRRGQR